MVTVNPSPVPVHPRPRGEHIASRTPPPVGLCGSSPPARGTPPPSDHESAFHGRFIPARAGNTRQSSPWAAWQTGSSPPARGTLRGPAASCTIGSSPPARGTRSQRVPEWLRRRNVGSSPPARGTPDQFGSVNVNAPSVHPRPRGEHARARWCTIAIQPTGVHGSSPPARGTQTTSTDRTRPTTYRFIPARAGNTALALESWFLLPSGSSPPARGTHEG